MRTSGDIRHQAPNLALIESKLVQLYGGKRLRVEFPEAVDDIWVRSPSGNAVCFPLPRGQGTYAAIAEQYLEWAAKNTPASVEWYQERIQKFLDWLNANPTKRPQYWVLRIP